MIVRRTFRVGGLAVLWAALLLLSAGLLGAETVTLESADGRKLEAELVGKGKDRVKIRMGRKVYVLPFDKLAAASVELVKAADLPVLCDFEITVDMNKRSDKVERIRQEWIWVGEERVRQTLTDSFRVDEVEGTVEVRNRDVADASPEGSFHVAVLANGAGGHKVLRLEKVPLKSLGALGEQKIPVGKSRCWHTPRGEDLPKGDIKVEGRYTGYIAAIVVEDQIVEIKASPSKYEDDLQAARRMLGLKRRFGEEK